MTKVPAVIHAHLLPFFYEEFAGKFSYEDKSFEKLVRIKRGSPLGTLIYELCDTKHHIYLRITSIPGALRSHFFGYLTINADDPIKLSPAKCQCINDLLEDMMRTALVFWVLGATNSSSDKKAIKGVIESFMGRYSLYDFDYNVEQLRVMYYRSKRNNNHFARSHNSPSTNSKSRVG